MAAVYILYSPSLTKYYVGSCLDLSQRLEQHMLKTFQDAFTATKDDWQLYFSISDLHYGQARRIEKHVKKMKSKSYIENLFKYPSIVERLIEKYK